MLDDIKPDKSKHIRAVILFVVKHCFKIFFKIVVNSTFVFEKKRTYEGIIDGHRAIALFLYFSVEDSQSNWSPLDIPKQSLLLINKAIES